MKFLKKAIDKIVEGGNPQFQKMGGNSNAASTEATGDVLDELPALPTIKKKQETASEPAKVEQPAPQKQPEQPQEKPQPVFKEEDFRPPQQQEPKATAQTEQISSKVTTSTSPSVQELPGLDDTHVASPKTEAVSAPQSSLVDMQKDQSLYFAVLRARLEDEKRQKEIIDELSQGVSPSQVINNLHSHFKQDKQAESLALIDQKIKHKMEPLQLLEHEWRVLQREMDRLSGRLRETEEEIKQNTSDLMRLIEEKMTEEEKHQVEAASAQLESSAQAEVTEQEQHIQH